MLVTNLAEASTTMRQGTALVNLRTAAVADPVGNRHADRRPIVVVGPDAVAQDVSVQSWNHDVYAAAAGAYGGVAGVD